MTSQASSQSVIFSMWKVDPTACISVASGRVDKPQVPHKSLTDGPLASVQSFLKQVRAPRLFVVTRDKGQGTRDKGQGTRDKGQGQTAMTRTLAIRSETSPRSLKCSTGLNVIQNRREPPTKPRSNQRTRDVEPRGRASGNLCPARDTVGRLRNSSRSKNRRCVGCCVVKKRM